jgi:hypothetical protein
MRRIGRSCDFDDMSELVLDLVELRSLLACTYTPASLRAFSAARESTEPYTP